MRYNTGGAAGAASSTAATAGIVKLDNPSSGDLATAAVKSFSVGPGSNSEDSCYAVQWKRQTTAGTWSAQTARAVDARNTVAAITLAGTASTGAGSAGNIIFGPVGFHHNGGIRVVLEPGSELVLTATASNGIILEYVFVQGTAVNYGAVLFEE